MADYSIREVIEMAVQTEKMGAAFYGEMAQKFKSDLELADFFNTLAKKEHVHEKRFAELKGILGDEEPAEWNEVAPYMRAFVESAFFLGRDKSTAHIQNTDNMKAAVGYALAFEKETLLFYYGIRDAVKEKDILDEIINEERSHIMWLNKFKNRQ